VTSKIARAAGCVALAACRSTAAPSQPPAEPYTLPLREPGAFHGDFIDRQKIHATYGDRSLSFEAVLQKQGDTLTLLGLTPFGSRAFVVRQVGNEVSFESFLPETLPFPPQYMLIDVQRVFLGWAWGDQPGGSDGSREALRQGEVVREEWQRGRLLRRSFRRVDGRPRGEIVIEYDGGMTLDGTPPAHVILTNGWYGYRLQIETESHQAL
jgi:uncharacterized protein DUF3261